MKPKTKKISAKTAVILAKGLKEIIESEEGILTDTLPE